MRELIKASEIQPGDKFHVMGMDLFVTRMTRTGRVIDINLENRRTVGTNNLTQVTASLTFNVDTWIEKTR